MVNKETNLIDLYVNLVILDSSYVRQCQCQDKDTEQHHPFIGCIFKNPEVRTSLEGVLNHTAYNLITVKNAQSDNEEMTLFYRKALKDY